MVAAVWVCLRACVTAILGGGCVWRDAVVQTLRQQRVVKAYYSNEVFSRSLDWEQPVRTCVSNVEVDLKRMDLTWPGRLARTNHALQASECAVLFRPASSDRCNG